MRYYKIYIFLIIIFLLHAGVVEANDTRLGYRNASLATEKEYAEILDVVASFTTYTYFFTNTYIVNGKIISFHGENFADGLDFLTRSFSEEIALNILDYYTLWHEGINQLTTIPCGGIPVFTQSDIDRSSFCIENGRINLKVNYYDCYELGDHYIYYITAYKAHGKYIINDLRWEKT